MPEIPPLLDVGIGVLVVIAIIWGWLVPRRYVLDIIAERDQWRQAHDEQRKICGELARAVDELNRGQAAITEMLRRSLPRERQD